MTGQHLLKNKIAIVTGAGAGAGRAIATRLSKSGAHVIINDIEPISARETETIIRDAGGDAAVVLGSVATPNTAKELVKAAQDRWGHLDILVNSASVTRNAMIHLLPDEWFALMIEVIVKGAFYCIRAAGPLMCVAAKPELASDKQVHRKIVNIASTAGIYGAAGKVAYAAATAAVIGMTKTVAREWAPFSVNCNALAPGLIFNLSKSANIDGMSSTIEPAVQAETQEYDFESLAPKEKAVAAQTKSPQRMPLGRIGTPDDIAGAVEFLVGPDSDFITGAVLEIHGGMEFSS